MSCTCRFRGYAGSRRGNDNKTMSLRRDELRDQLEAAGESVGEDVTFLAVTAASAAVFLVSVARVPGAAQMLHLHKCHI
jgi:hypothetical protein